MTRFNPNPIVVRDNGKPFKIIELAYDYENDDFSILEVCNLSGQVLERYEMNKYTLISLDRKLGSIKLVYKDKVKGYIGEEIINIENVEAVGKVISDEELVYLKLKNAIKQEMDFPSGTDIEVSKHTELLKQATSNKNARIYITSKIRKIITGMNIVPNNKIEDYTYKLYSDLYGMGVIQELDDDIEVGEIMVNAVTFPKFQADIYYIKNQIKHKYNKSFETLEELKNVFSRTIEFNKKELNSVDNAIVEATRPNKDRVNIIIPDASDNWVLNIRKFSNFIPNLGMMKKSGTVDDYIEELMKVLVKGKANIGIGGPMNSGKTTFINFLLTYTDPLERKVVIASVSETDIDRVLKGHDVCIFNVDDEKGFTFEKHLKASMRTTADRVIVPESRGGEFKQVYEANLKTKGNIFTAHALDDESFLDMCVDMYLSSSESKNENSQYIKNKLAKSIDIIIIMTKVGDKIRLQSISEILLNENREYDKMNVLYEYVVDPENPTVGEYRRTDNRLSDSIKKRLNKNGVPMSVMANL